MSGIVVVVHKQSPSTLDSSLENFLPSRGSEVCTWRDLLNIANCSEIRLEDFAHSCLRHVCLLVPREACEPLPSPKTPFLDYHAPAAEPCRGAPILASQNRDSNPSNPWMSRLSSTTELFCGVVSELLDTVYCRDLHSIRA
jgi:hypothetical protein